jgi:hypothetical protein
VVLPPLEENEQRLRAPNINLLLLHNTLCDRT